MANESTRHMIVDLKTGFAYGIKLDAEGKCTAVQPLNTKLETLEGRLVKTFGPLAGNSNDLVRLLARVEALQAFLGTEAGRNLLTAYGRAANIVRAEEKKDKGLAAKIAGAPDAALLEQAEEKTVATALDQVARAVKPALAAEDFAGAMAAFAGLRGPIDALFDKVTVNVTDRPEVRLNRLKLLNQIRATMDAVADFSKIEG